MKGDIVYSTVRRNRVTNPRNQTSEPIPPQTADRVTFPWDKGNIGYLLVTLPSNSGTLIGQGVFWKMGL